MICVIVSLLYHWSEQYKIHTLGFPSNMFCNFINTFLFLRSTYILLVLLSEGAAGIMSNIITLEIFNPTNVAILQYYMIICRVSDIYNWY